MVASTSSHYSLAGTVAKYGKFVHRTTNFECASALQVFCFKQHRPSAAFAEMSRWSYWCVCNNPPITLGNMAHFLEGNLNGARATHATTTVSLSCKH
jgi:hypothetical protein